MLVGEEIRNFFLLRQSTYFLTVALICKAERTGFQEKFTCSTGHDLITPKSAQKGTWV